MTQGKPTTGLPAAGQQIEELREQFVRYLEQKERALLERMGANASGEAGRADLTDWLGRR
jgi:hypothetical protein